MHVSRPWSGGYRNALAFKAYEIEELADRYFFRPLGMILARGAAALGLSPTSVTLIGTGVGVAGGALLSTPATALWAFPVLILHSILDSSDGQLARMTGRTSEFGRVLDGVGGYATHIAIYGGVITSALRAGAGARFVALSLGAGLCNILHAQMYDYHRNAYTALAIKGLSPTTTIRTAHLAIARCYEAMERAIAGAHPAVEARIARNAEAGRVRESDRVRYRACFYGPVRGWNLMGDNTRIYAVGVCAWLQRVDGFVWFTLVPMNIAFVALWWWQARADQRFLDAAPCENPDVARHPV